MFCGAPRVFNPPCNSSPFLRRLTNLGYRDALEMSNWGFLGDGIDYIFTRGNIADVLWDKKFKQLKYLYSDHPIGTVLLEDEDVTPPTQPEHLITIEKPDELRLLWESDWDYWVHEAGWDGGSGFRKWLVHRREDHETKWKLIGTPRSGRFR